jgi:hypothetical protein
VNHIVALLAEKLINRDHVLCGTSKGDLVDAVPGLSQLWREDPEDPSGIAVGKNLALEAVGLPKVRGA